jgi:acyl-CoA thioesterase YciA
MPIVVAVSSDYRLKGWFKIMPREPTLRMTMLPRDTNARGTIFGGVILSHIDLAGGVAASRQAPRNFVTRAMHEVEFIAPVYVGDVVSFYTNVLREGKTSITIQVEVEAERRKEPARYVKVTEAEVIFVAVDEAGNPIPIR